MFRLIIAVAQCEDYKLMMVKRKQLHNIVQETKRYLFIQLFALTHLSLFIQNVPGNVFCLCQLFQEISGFSIGAGP
jgi:hypothetical protein